jgi:hypothetical protein
MQEKVGEVNSTKSFITNDEISRWILNGCHTSFFRNDCVLVVARVPAVRHPRYTAPQFLMGWYQLRGGTQTHAECIYFGYAVLYLFFFLFVRWDFGYWGHYWPNVPAPDDRWWWLWRNWWNEDWQGKQKYSEKTCPQCHFVHHKSLMTRPGPPRWEASD